MANEVISTPADLSELDMQQRVVPVEYKHRPATPGLAKPSFDEAAESPACRSLAARGALLGITLGAAIYGAALILLGVIKL
jgi:hypothetical protein